MTDNISPRRIGIPWLPAALILTLMSGGLRASGPPPEVNWDAAAARHLLSRACFGGSPEEARRLAAMPLEKAVDRILDEAAAARPPDRPEWVRDVWVNTLRRYSDMPREEYLVMFRRASTRNDEELADLKGRWLRYMVTTGAPLREQMTLFWHGHFTSATSKMFAVTQAFYQQNQTWRRHALGNFREFLEAVTLDPGMMIYLDMEESNRDNPNENYARELLELFTLGVGHYTEKDIREAARALTGWTLDAPPGTIKPGRPTSAETARSMRRDGLVPTFLPERHDTGTKTVLGQTGNFGVKEVLDIIVNQPACGDYLAGRLIEFFGAWDPSGTLRSRMARAFVENSTEIRPMLRVLFTSPEFYAPEARGNRVKSPIRLLVGACRDLRIDGEFSAALAQSIVPLGQELFNPPTVKGWPGSDAWITATTLTLRQRMPEVLLDGRPLSGTEPLGRTRGTLIPRDPAEGAKVVRRLLDLDAEKARTTAGNGLGTRFDPLRLDVPGDNRDVGPLVDALLERMLVVKARRVTRESIAAACRAVPPGERAAVAVRLILASPEYQVE